MTTNAAVLVQTGCPLELIELNLPSALKPGQVLVKMRYSGICRTQINEIGGKKGPDKFLPHTLGHEGAGIVLKVADGVTKVATGDHVIVSWIKGEGADVPSTQYTSKIGPVNSGAVSTFLDKAVISENRLFPIGNNFNLKHAALFGCAIPTGAGIVFNQCSIDQNSRVAIFGLGGIGLSALLAASIKGAKQIIAIDAQEEKKELAFKFGAHHFIDPTKEPALDIIDELTCGEGVCYAIEAVGIKEVMQAAFSAVKVNGGLCVLAGNLGHHEKIEIDPFDLIRGKRIIGTWGGAVLPDRDLPKFLEQFSEKCEELDLMISHVEPLSQINRLLQLLENGKISRGMIKF